MALGPSEPPAATEPLQLLEVRAAPVNASAARAVRESTKPSKNPRWHASLNVGARRWFDHGVAAHAARERPQFLLQGERVNDLLDLQLRVRRSQSVSACDCLVLEQPEVARQKDTST